MGAHNYLKRNKKGWHGLRDLEFTAVHDIYTTPGVDDFVLLDISLEQFSESLRRQCFNVTILDDSIAEGTEMFAVTLQIAVGESSPQVRISPASANIEIIDDECKSLIISNTMSCYVYSHCV